MVVSYHLLGPLNYFLRSLLVRFKTMRCNKKVLLYQVHIYGPGCSALGLLLLFGTPPPTHYYLLSEDSSHTHTCEELISMNIKIDWLTSSSLTTVSLHCGIRLIKVEVVGLFMSSRVSRTKSLTAITPGILSLFLVQLKKKSQPKIWGCSWRKWVLNTEPGSHGSYCSCLFAGDVFFPAKMLEKRHNCTDDFS